MQPIKCNQSNAIIDNRSNQMQPIKCNQSNATKKKLLPIIDNRDGLGPLLQKEGMKTGLEIGVQAGGFSEAILQEWTECEKYSMIDPWENQEHFDDGANVDDAAQESLMQKTKDRLHQFETRGTNLEYLRGFSNQKHAQIARDSMDFIYIDGRHDYVSVSEDLRLFWPKLRDGGIFAGHDFEDAHEVGRWYLDPQGNKQEEGKAVKAAVEEFAEEQGVQIVTTRRESQYATWYMRK